MGHGFGRRTVVLALLVTAACSSDSKPDSSSSTRAVESSATTTPPTTAIPPTTLPTSGPVVLESTHYPYALTVQAEQIVGPFRPASVAWNGHSGVTRDSPVLDNFNLSGGVFFVLGTAWSSDLESFAQMFADLQAERNNCSPELQLRREVTVATTPALVYVQGSCGTGDEVFARLAVVHDGFGLIAFGATSPGQENATMDRLVSQLNDVAWTTG